MGSMYCTYKALFPPPINILCLDHRGNISKAPVLQTFSRIAHGSKAKYTHLSDRQFREVVGFVTECFVCLLAHKWFILGRS